MSPGYPCSPCCEPPPVDPVSCSCCSTTITSDSIVTWPSHSISGEAITRINNSAPAVTFYVNSVAGGGAESGSGTELDPWTNFNTVFSDDCIFDICVACSGCAKVKVLVKGTINYVIVGNAVRDYARNLIIESWGGSGVTIGITGSSFTIGLLNCKGCIFKGFNVTVTVLATTSGDAVGFRSCSSSTFDTCVCTISGTNTDPDQFGATAVGFQTCFLSVFFTCTGDATADESSQGDSAVAKGFDDCNSSVFDTCDATVDATAIADSFGAFATGFRANNNSAFDTCSGTATAQGSDNSNDCCGFYLNSGSSFLDCSESDNCATPVCDI